MAAYLNKLDTRLSEAKFPVTSRRESMASELPSAKKLRCSEV